MLQYLRGIESDITEQLGDRLAERNFSIAHHQETDGSFSITFENGATGLGSTISLHILSQIESNEFIATWNSVKIRYLKPASARELGNDGTIFAPNFGPTHVVREFSPAEGEKSTTRNTLLSMLEKELKSPSFANFAKVPEKFWLSGLKCGIQQSLC